MAKRESDEVAERVRARVEHDYEALIEQAIELGRAHYDEHGHLRDRSGVLLYFDNDGNGGIVLRPSPAIEKR
jgi:hypothetical protein